LAVQADGKIVVAGFAQPRASLAGVTVYGTLHHIALARYNPDGTLDPVFGSEGKVISTFPVTSGALDGVANAIAMKGDGKIVVAGRASSVLCDEPSCDPVNIFSRFALAQYEGDGTLDPTFGRDGMVTTSFGVEGEANAVAVQEDGKIVAAGFAAATTLEGEVKIAFALARYKPDGVLDRTFSGDGKVTTSLDKDDDDEEANGIAIQADGGVVVAGSGCCANGSFVSFLLARYQG
jgi:uncharacterized delta-60 repeat protein